MGANRGTLVDVNEALLHEIVEIAGESSAERILRKSHAALHRLIPNTTAKFTITDLSVVEVESSIPLMPEQLEIAETLAKTATLSINNVLSNDLATKLRINEERLRIARDLHDRVLQKIFATGLSLEGALRKAVGDDVIKALKQAIIDLDETVGEIRTTVYSLKGPRTSIRQLILLEIERARKMWNVPIDFNLSGPIDTVVSKELFDDVIAVTSELLNNAGKHGHGQRVRYELQATGEELEIIVSNNGGENPTIPHFGNGLNNLSERASQYNGKLSVENLLPGLKVTWKIAL